MISANHQMSAKVKVPFIPNPCWVEGVKFTEEGKVLYDIGVSLSDGSTVIKDVDSVYVEPIDEPKAAPLSAGSTGDFVGVEVDF